MTLRRMSLEERADESGFGISDDETIRRMRGLQSSSVRRPRDTRLTSRSEGRYAMENLTAEQLVELGEKDRYALIYDEEYEGIVMKNIRKIFRLYPCTGVLVRQKHGGVSYHVSKLSNAEAIRMGGLRPTMDDGATYAGGVIYTYPSVDCYTGLSPAKHALFKVTYSGGTLRAIATFDKDDKEQGEILVPPECVKSVEQVPIPTTPTKINRIHFS